MEREEFLAYMNQRGFTPEVVTQHLSMVERFEAYMGQRGVPISSTSPEDVWAFATDLTQKDPEPYQELLPVLRYFYATKNRPAFLAGINMLDGGEVMGRFYERAEKVLGKEMRDQIFELPLANLATPPQEKAEAMRKVMEKLEGMADQATIEKLFASSLRDLGDEGYSGQKKMFEESSNIDEYLVRQGKAFIAQLRGIMERGELFFNQEITEDVIRYVEGNPEILHGVRQGNIMYHTKIPYMAKEYLAEKDETLKRYYACHCPWARASILTGKEVSPTFCNCSAGFEKKAWEIIFAQPLKTDVLQTALKGDTICRFAVHLPDGLK